MAELTRAVFVIDSLPESEFRGYTDGTVWNGWSRPLFEFEEAQRVLQASEPNGFEWQYDRERDEFEVRYTLQMDEDPEIFEGIQYQVDGAKLRLYPIGAGSWIWETTED